MREITYAAIPTVYGGIQFRSRLEARYACLFDKYGIPFEYEPLDLKNYIPDFLIELPNGTVLLWECKPAVKVTEFRRPARRIAKSGWTGPAIVAGSGLALFGGRPDLMLHATEAAGSSGFFRAGNGKWPGYWGPYPFEGVFSVWREAGNEVQWLPPKG